MNYKYLSPGRLWNFFKSCYCIFIFFGYNNSYQLLHATKAFFKICCREIQRNSDKIIE